MTKNEKQHIVNQYLDQYINPIEQYRSTPITVFNNWICWLYEQWNCGMLNIKEYRGLIKIDLDDYIGV